MKEQNQPVVKNVLLFPSRRGAFEGETYSAVLMADGSVELRKSALSYTDARIFGHGELKPAVKHSLKSPDFKGFLVDPYDDFIGGPVKRWKIAGWWKQIQRGSNAGANYLSMCLTEEVMEQAERSCQKLADSRQS